MVYIILMGICGAAFLLGVLVSAALGALAAVLMVRDAKKRRHGWWAFGITTALLFACLVMLINARPDAMNFPHSVDMKNLFLNCVGYGASLGVAALVACAVTLLIPRPKRSALEMPSRNEAIPPIIEGAPPPRR